MLAGLCGRTKRARQYVALVPQRWQHQAGLWLPIDSPPESCPLSAPAIQFSISKERFSAQEPRTGRPPVHLPVLQQDDPVLGDAAAGELAGERQLLAARRRHGQLLHQLLRAPARMPARCERATCRGGGKTNAGGYRRQLGCLLNHAGLTQAS